MAEAIEVSITSQDVLSLKQSCEVIINEYKRFASSIVVEDESGIYPVLLSTIKGLKSDVQAGKDTLENFQLLTLDEIDRPKETLDTLSSYKDIEKITGNYTITQSVYDEAQKDVKDLFDGLKHREAPRLEETKGESFKKDNLITKSQQEYPGSKYGQSLPSPLSEQINQSAGAGSRTGSFKADSKGKFPNTLLEECIPCNFRLNGLDGLDPSLGLIEALKEMVERYKKILESIDKLFNNTDVAEDLCSLLNFLDFQCIPDLFAIIALLIALMNKYRDLIPNLDGAFMMFIGPFFSPLLGGLNELLDKFIQMIMAPIDCITNALDTTLAKLDVQRAVSTASTANISFHRKREGYLRRKIEQLEERRSYLKELKNDGADGDSPPTQRIGGRPRSSHSDSNGRTNPLRDALEESPATGQAPKFETSIFGTKTINEEISRLDDDISDASQKYNKEYGEKGENNLTKVIKENQIPSATVIGNARGAVRDARQGISSSLYELRSQILNGRRMVNDTLRILREELQRLIFGRAASSEEMMEGLRNIQRVARLIGIVKTLIKLAKGGKLCDNSNGDPSVALGSFLTANKGTNQTNSYYNVYIGQNDNGDDSLLIAPSDAVLEIEDPEADGLVQLDNLDEIDKLNRDGIPKDIGNITDKRITATTTDLGFKTPVSVIEFNLCNNSAFSTEADISKIESWAVSAGFSI